MVAVAGGFAWAGWVSPGLAQAAGADPIEIPLRVENGRMIVTVDGPSGRTYDFVVGLGMTLITESGVATVGDDMASLTLGGIPVETEQSQTVPDAYLSLGTTTPTGVLGGLTLNKFDVLFDVPGERLIVKPVGRSVRWDDISLSNPVGLTLFHDVLIRVDVEVGGKLFGGLLDLASPGLEINEPLHYAAGLESDRVDSFRMGYTGWPDLPFAVVDSPIFQGWDPDGKGFVVIGAAVVADCPIAISWAHQEMRTCLR